MNREYDRYTLISRRRLMRRLAIGFVVVGAPIVGAGVAVGVNFSNKPSISELFEFAKGSLKNAGDVFKGAGKAVKEAVDPMSVR